MEKFYHDLLSPRWEERLSAYAVLERDLRRRKLFSLSEREWEDMALLVGQIMSIHFKRHQVKDFAEFLEALSLLYGALISPLRVDKSHGYKKSRELLTEIYDDDDYAAQKEIDEFFMAKGKLKDSATVLENLFRCYEAMMQRAKVRILLAASA